MRFAFLLVFAAACSSQKAGQARVARWEIDGDGSYAVSMCPQCDAPVAHDGNRCADCGAAYRVVPRSIECPDCSGTTRAACAACEGAGKCPICEGSGAFEGASCPECEGKRSCPGCRAAPAHACDNCLGEGTIEVR